MILVKIKSIYIFLALSYLSFAQKPFQDKYINNINVEPFLFQEAASKNYIHTQDQLLRYYENYYPLMRVTFKYWDKLLKLPKGKLLQKITRGFFTAFIPIMGEGRTFFLQPHGFASENGIIVVHEFAHRRAHRSVLGTDPRFNPELNIIGDNPFSYSLGFFSSLNETGGYTWENGKLTDIWDADPNSDYSRIYKFLPIKLQKSLFEFAAGINQQSNIAKRYTNRVWIEEEIDVADFFSYYQNSLSYFSYGNTFLDLFQLDLVTDSPDEEGDRHQMIKSWRIGSGIGLNDGSLSQLNLIGFVISGTSFHFYKAIYNYIINGTRKVKLKRIKGFRLPDFFSYYVDEGATLQMVTDYKIDSTAYVGITIEKLIEGKNENVGMDLGVTLKKTLLNNKLNIYSSFLYNTNSSENQYNISSSLFLSDKLHIRSGFNSVNLYTLAGERDLPSLEFGTKYNEWYFSLAYTLN